MSVIVKVNETQNMANVVGRITQNVIGNLHFAGFSCVRQEGERGFIRDSYTVPLDEEQQLTLQGLITTLKCSGVTVNVQ